MLNILQDPYYRALIRLDRKVKVTSPVTVVKEGACVTLDTNKEITLAGTVVDTTNTGPFTFVASSADKLVIVVDGGSEQTITFGAGSTSTDDTVTAINAIFPGLASNNGGAVRFSALLSIDFKAASNTLTLLGLTAGVSNVAETGLVYWAFTSANDPDEPRSDFAVLEQITLVHGILLAETDQFDTGGSYGVGTLLAALNAKLIPAKTGDRVIARSMGPVANNILQIMIVGRPEVA